MAYLDWIKDEYLINAVKIILEKASEAKKNANKNFNKNVLDPFSAFFEITGFDVNYKEWIINEKTRQAQKTLQNHIGDFHQKILGSCIGWENMHTGNEIDLVSEKKKIIAEVKNKYNTLTGGALGTLYKSLDKLVMQKSSRYKDFTAYYVYILPKSPKRFDKPFTPSDKEKGQRFPINELIREIDGASFYEIVTGNKNALEELFEILPFVFGKIIGKSPSSGDFKELKKIFETAYKGEL